MDSGQRAGCREAVTSRLDKDVGGDLLADDFAENGFFAVVTPLGRKQYSSSGCSGDAAATRQV
jgi:hypothetical protein